MLTKVQICLAILEDTFARRNPPISYREHREQKGDSILELFETEYDREIRVDFSKWWARYGVKTPMSNDDYLSQVESLIELRISDLVELNGEPIGAGKNLYRYILAKLTREGEREAKRYAENEG